jgi:hypothetical protein
MRRSEIVLEDEHDRFKLVQTISWSNSYTSNFFLYYAMKFDAPNRLWAATFIVWRTTS